MTNEEKKELLNRLNQSDLKTEDKKIITNLMKSPFLNHLDRIQ